MIRKILRQLAKNVLTLLGEPSEPAIPQRAVLNPPMSEGDFRQAQRYLKNSAADIAQAEKMLLAGMTILAQLHYETATLEAFCWPLKKARLHIEYEITEINRNITKD